MLSSSRKPKFALDLTLKDLTNIPHTNGYVFIEVLIKGSLGRSLRTAIPSFKPLSKSNSSTAVSMSDSLTNKDKSGLSDSELANLTTSSTSTSSSNIHVRTSQRKIHNFKCVFNYTVHCNLKLPYNKKTQSIGSKFLLIRVFYVGEQGSKSDLCSHSTELGRCEFDLASYIDVNHPVNSKFLLQDSKVNSILSLSASLKELPSDFDFHTQLHIEDTHTTQSLLSISKRETSGDLSSKARKGAGAGQDSLRSPQSSSANDSQQKNGYHKDELLDPFPNSQGESYDKVILDPIVTSLYRKTLESSWDPDLHVLLTLLPEKIVNDIFDKGNNSKLGEDYDLYRNLGRTASKELAKEEEGLFTEGNYRENMKSWSISWA